MHTEQVTPFLPPATVQDRPASRSGDVHAIMFTGHALIEGGQQVSAEMLAFWQSRLKDAVATGRQLLECSSAEDAWEIQLEYAQAALQAYVDQTTKVAGLVTHALTESLLLKAPTAAPSRSTAALTV